MTAAAPPAPLPPIDDAALRHVAELVAELGALVRAARAGAGAGRVERIEAAIAQARAVSATLGTAMVSARDRVAGH
ncbi:hypothetical protein Dfulv_29165 [Dactylosporangium fulvum]|uniref:Uncharacterized protein n=1 Tax=Dactylosporangium fulvum TaxID=53359 RepID=A0ABY5VNE2_9ACTN|nr:hypothetical protein [Dactylosporangium fulvum]UWP79233.1 hypothetical protein Dfulv_29165 [Dactylosporangium fulvum]